jgi:hypothetical protein
MLDFHSILIFRSGKHAYGHLSFALAHSAPLTSFFASTLRFAVLPQDLGGVSDG